MYQGKFLKKEARRTGKGSKGSWFLRGMLVYVLGFYLIVFSGLLVLRNWLIHYEAAQPTQKCQAVFRELFADPDWEQLYTLAGIQDTAYESPGDFVAHMESAVGNAQLTYMETSAGLSEDRKYNVLLGDQKIAAFTLTDRSSGETLPDWQLGKVEIFFNREAGCFITMPEGCTALVNGIALNDNQIIRISTPRAQDYLPVGTAYAKTVTAQVEGLLAIPEVVVLDAEGLELPVDYDEINHTFTARTEELPISDAQREIALNAVKTYALYMIEKAGAPEVAKYFDRTSDTYEAIIKTDRSAVQDAKKREFVNETVTDYCCYSEELFSVRVSLTLNLYRSNGTIKENHISQSLFFRNRNGKWVCYQMTAVDTSAYEDQVRLTFSDGSGVISSGFVAADATDVLCPVVIPPEGKVLSGWTVRERDENGREVLRVVFTPDASGLARLTPGTVLEPMTLYPLFEELSAS